MVTIEKFKIKMKKHILKDNSLFKNFKISSTFMHSLLMAAASLLLRPLLLASGTALSFMLVIMNKFEFN